MLARGVRNVIYNYTDAQRKVRSATSNDAWGPSPALMHEIADLTDNVVAYAEIMPIIWKRLNDHGKNWRHVYKSLVLLDHLIKYGNERVSQQCKENIFAIQTLKDFQYIEDQKDQGYNVREKAKQLVALLKDDERLRNERRKAQEARERYSRQAIGMDSSGTVTYGRPVGAGIRRNSSENIDNLGKTPYPTHPFPTNSNTTRSTSFSDNLHSVVVKDFVQPTNQEEEQLQMQIALAESQRDADDEERRRRNDELKLKIALERSVNETSPDGQVTQGFNSNGNSHGLDASLFDTNTPSNPYLPPPTTMSNIGWNPANARPSTHLGFTITSNDPWSSESSGRNSAMTIATNAHNDPWQSATASSNTQVNPWPDNHHSQQHSITNDGNGLSINTEDPWGLTTSPSQSSSTNTNTTNTKTIDNELSEFFGAGATLSATSPQQQGSSNPWNISSSTFPISSTNINHSSSISPSNNGLTIGGPILNPNGLNSNSNNPSPLPSIARKTPESFLGEDFCNLVNLDKLVTQTKSNTNPFGSTAPRAQNPFANINKPPTLEQLSSSNNVGFTSTSTLPPPLIPSSFNNNNNNNNTTTTTTNNPFI